MGTAAGAAEAGCLQLNERWESGTPGKIRTCDLWFRRPTLYPTELRALRVRAGAVRLSFVMRLHLVTYLARRDQIAACGSEAGRGISKTGRLPPNGTTAGFAKGTPRWPPTGSTAGGALSRRRVGPPPHQPSPFGSASATPPQGGSDNTPEERGEAHSNPYSALFPFGRALCLKNSRWPECRWIPP